MTLPTPGRRRRFRPEITLLESRRLLTVTATCLGQDGQDLVGPTASQGRDGIQDLHLQLSGLAGAVSQVVVQAPGGFEWATEPDPTGAALAEYFPSSTSGHGDLYINPQVRSDVSASGGSLPLGGSTGSLIGLTNGTVALHPDRLSGADCTRHGDRRRVQPGLSHRSHARDRYSRRRGRHFSGDRSRPGRQWPGQRNRLGAPGHHGAQRC